MSFLWNMFSWFKREKAIPLGKILPGQIPGFMGSPYFQLATIIEQWGPLRVVDNMSPFRLTEYFQGLHMDILTTRERQMAASIVAWSLLTALNQAEMR